MRNLYTIFQSDCTSLHFHQRCTGLPFLANSCQYLPSVSFCFVLILTTVTVWGDLHRSFDLHFPGNNSKNQCVELHQTKMLLQSKGNNPQNESICKLYIWKRINIQIYKNSYNSIANKQNAILKWEKKLNRLFCKEYIWMANKYVKRYATSRIIRETIC